MSKIQLTVQHSLGLSLAQREKYRKLWNRINSDPLAFVPSIFKNNVTVAEALAENKILAQFSVGYWKQILALSVKSPDHVIRRFASEAKVVGVGYGKGYDSKWFATATDCGFETWWLDVSDVAIGNAVPDLTIQFLQTSRKRIICPKPQIRMGEIRSVLESPDWIGLDIKTVELWYLCRVIGCMPQTLAKATLQLLGWRALSEEFDPEKTKGIVIINALRDYNPGYESEISRLPSKKKIVTNINMGAKRKVEICMEASCRYFDKIVTAMFLTAK